MPTLQASPGAHTLVGLLVRNARGSAADILMHFTYHGLVICAKPECDKPCLSRAARNPNRRHAAPDRRRRGGRLLLVISYKGGKDRPIIRQRDRMLCIRKFC